MLTLGQLSVNVEATREETSAERICRCVLPLALMAPALAVPMLAALAVSLALLPLPAPPLAPLARPDPVDVLLLVTVVSRLWV